MVSADPDGIFGPDPKTAVKADGVTPLDPTVGGSADQQTIHRLIVSCDDVTNWVRQ